MNFICNFSKENNILLHYVIISTSNKFGTKFNPKKVYIYFNNLPARDNRTYEFLRKKEEKLKNIERESIQGDDNSTSKKFFYLFSKEKFTVDKIEVLRNEIFKKIDRLEQDNAIVDRV